MIEILHRSDIEKIVDDRIKDYLLYSFLRLPEDYIYPDYGYFVVIESIKDLESDLIKLSTISLPNIENGLFDDIELVEIQDEIIELVILYDNDFGVSLIIPMEILGDIHQETLKSYVLG